MLQPQPVTPVIIKVVPTPTPEVGVVDILVGSLGLTGLIVVASLLVGLLLGGVLIVYTRWRDNRLPDGDTTAATTLRLSGPR
jgi:ABC-type dipeptide/oligopeptide/nickel transport system permease component